MRDRIVFAAYAAMALASCAFFEVPVVDDWTRVRIAVPVTSWTRVKNVNVICQQPKEWHGVACARVNLEHKTCDVYSAITEDAARNTWWHDGMKVYDHEAKHCAGFDHAASTVRSLTAAQGVVR